jgi:ABC-type nickel/cobalt efflux system permease component RcnA
MSWFEIVAVSVILAWACVFLWRRWGARKAHADQCGHSNNANCGQ